ncbi:MAG: glutathione synthetase [Candidatus Binatia bacterium]|nr:MAG: glutathione synthetase [Candidatus Binatia bacterium]
MPRRYAFVMDPLDRILPDKDTTFVFMLEAQRRGEEVYYLGPEHLFVEGGTPHARAWRCEVRRATPHYTLHEERTGELAWFDAVFMRKDPPFDLPYYFATQILGLVDPARTFVLNDPRGLREANEKLYALHFPDLVPPTLVSREIPRLKAFLDAVGGEMIVKPLDGCGGSGVFYLRRGDKNVNVLLETATANETRWTMAQKYLPEAREGDKRIVLLDGEPLGATLRVPAEDEHRGNIHVGGRCVRTELTERDRAICARLRDRLKADGLYFVGLDVIGGWLTEVNVTSPTGVQEIDRLEGVELERAVLDFVEEKVRRPSARGRT